MSFYYYKKVDKKSPWCLFYDYVHHHIFIKKEKEYWNFVVHFTTTSPETSSGAGIQQVLNTYLLNE